MRLVWMMVVVAAMGAGVGVALGDTIELKDGRTLSGTMRRDGNVVTITGADGKVTVQTTADQIVRVTLTGSVTPEQAAEAEWTRVTVQVGKATDLATIIELHKKFLEKYPDQAVSKTVQTSLEAYETLEREKAVKFRGRWMPAVQVDVMIRMWDEEARPAMELYRAGKLRECLEAAAKLVVGNDQNPTAITLAGLAAYRLNQLQTAREYFKKLGQVDPSTPLGWNNLAVIAAQQHNQVESLQHYLKALQAAPDNRMVLDNIEEAMVNFAGDRTSAAFMDLARQFDIAEKQVEGEMAGKGLYRWGSTWVTRDAFDKLAAYRQAVQGAMEQLDRAYHDRGQGLADINNEIAKSTADYNNILSGVNSLNQVISATQFGQDVGDLIMRRDSMMNDLEAIRAKKAGLEAQRDAMAAGMPAFAGQAEKLKGAMAVSDASMYPGIQRIMQVGEDKRPPAPLAIAVAKIPGFAPMPLPAMPRAGGAVKAAPVSADEVARKQAGETYRELGTPLGLPMPK